jgi:hypothetical protein
VTDRTIIRAARWVDVETGEVRSPAAVIVEGKRIGSVDPGYLADIERRRRSDVTLL